MSGSGDILVIKLHGLRSFVQCLPALRALRQHHRGKRITFLTTEELYQIAQDSPYVDDAETLPPLDDKRTLKFLAQTIKREKFERIYDLENNATTQRIFRALKPFPPAWVGEQRGAKYRYAPPAGVSAADRPMQIVAAGGVPVPERIILPDARWAASARTNAPSLKPEFFNLRTPFVLLCVDAPRGGEAVEWPAARFAGLAVRLHNAGYGVGVLSETEDRTGVKAVLDACGQAIDLCMRADPTQVAALGTHAAAVVGHRDGEFTHLLAAAGAPVIALARTHEEALALGPRGGRVIHVTTAQSELPLIDYMSALLDMYAGIGERERPARTETVAAAHP